MASIQELQNQQAELFKIIQAKDEEIGEYKLQGATLFRSESRSFLCLSLQEFLIIGTFS